MEKAKAAYQFRGGGVPNPRLTSLGQVTEVIRVKYSSIRIDGAYVQQLKNHLPAVVG